MARGVPTFPNVGTRKLSHVRQLVELAGAGVDHAGVLEVTDGDRVLEIGTGSGYNAALLCERLGSDQVTSVDIDPELVELARELLAANGYTPALAAVDGAGGYPEGAPYDRIIATCSVPAVPSAWLAQVLPGVMIMVDVRGKLEGTVVWLTVDGDGTATSHFLPGYASFKPLRHTVEFPPASPLWETDRRTGRVGQPGRPGTASMGWRFRVRGAVAPPGRYLDPDYRGRRRGGPPPGTGRLPCLGSQHQGRW